VSSRPLGATNSKDGAEGSSSARLERSTGAWAGANIPSTSASSPASSASSPASLASRAERAPRAARERKPAAVSPSEPSPSARSAPAKESKRPPPAGSKPQDGFISVSVDEWNALKQQLVVQTEVNKHLMQLLATLQASSQ
jgi:hypothetical protein